MVPLAQGIVKGYSLAMSRRAPKDSRRVLYVDLDERTSEMLQNLLKLRRSRKPGSRVSLRDVVCEAIHALAGG